MNGLKLLPIQRVDHFRGAHPVARDTLAQAERVLGAESEFKLAHFRLLIAIKNELTGEQIDMIDRVIRRKREQIME